MTLFLFLVILAYLMGSFCSAIIVCRLFGLPDPREEGSKNPGATNVLRIAGKKYAAFVMIGDVLKGTIPVLIAKALGATPAVIAFTALAAVIGHMFPVFFKFKGGKGVATAIGALLGFHFIIGVMVATTWLLVANFSRYSSLASIVAISLSPFYSLLVVGRLDIFPPLFFIALLVLYKHKNNINRLIDGVEPKIKFKPDVIHDIMESPSVINDNEEVPTQKPVAPESKTEKVKEKIKEKVEEKTPKSKAPEKNVKTTKAAPKKANKTEEPTKKAKTTKPKSTKAKEEK
ncbi:glycerol-3-phosphate 1-O-acyltransferase PlsY [Legionella bononiensis]|uniref:Glycerol-3-phosphate acyltransferase n=1 Tax=Legionella bononiensis TaxID=2793102 RepID=A0ABS1WAV5_9GAMM|nr:glycerol-3-phosphate 1-O-acyltransferase PlsY [Legionella bononiensis]MBL7526496.1 glycerol-3-phosphate 1-O-acyltransferase PlsY [Legionella bononiensis]MBL7563010.1 glycerol-3-phosphate 1-O-acyltransferase PlsY [Legionella bononiensis]